MIVGSEVPNLIEPGAASTLVVSQDVDIGVPIAVIPEVKARLRSVTALRPSDEEPSVWVPTIPPLIEANFLGIDPDISDVTECYVKEDPELPLLVFGQLSLLRPARRTTIDGVELTLPEASGLILEKLLTDRVHEKGDRDLLVALALLTLVQEAELEELARAYATLAPELRYGVLSNLTVLSLMEGRPGMPDPAPHREKIARLLRRLESAEGDR